jgi:hypothetical protein
MCNLSLTNNETQTIFNVSAVANFIYCKLTPIPNFLELQI